MENVEVAVREAIEQLAAGLGVATDFLWPIMIRQAWIEGIFYGFWTVVGWTGVILVVKFLPGLIRKAHDTGGDGDFGKALVCGGGGVVSIFLVAINMGKAMGRLLNPEYYALAKVTTQIGKIIN